MLNIFIVSASFANPLSLPQYPGCGCTGTTCKSSRWGTLPADGWPQPAGLPGALSWGPPVSLLLGSLHPSGMDTAGDRGSPPWPPCCSSPPHTTLLTPQDLLYCSVMNKLLGNRWTILILIYVTRQWVCSSCFPSTLLITNCSSQTRKVSAQPRSDQKERALHRHQPQSTEVWRIVCLLRTSIWNLSELKRGHQRDISAPASAVHHLSCHGGGHPSLLLASAHVQMPWKQGAELCHIRTTEINCFKAGQLLGREEKFVYHTAKVQRQSK